MASCFARCTRLTCTRGGRCSAVEAAAGHNKRGIELYNSQAQLLSASTASRPRDTTRKVVGERKMEWKTGSTGSQQKQQEKHQHRHHQHQHHQPVPTVLGRTMDDRGRIALPRSSSFDSPALGPQVGHCVHDKPNNRRGVAYCTLATPAIRKRSESMLYCNSVRIQVTAAIA